MKIIVVKIMTIATGIMILLGTSISFYLLQEKNNIERNITINSTDSTTKKMSISVADMYPGEKREFFININFDIEGQFNMGFNFIEKKDTGLKKYIIVGIECDNENIASDPLSAFFNKDVKFERLCHIGDKLKVAINYNIPKETGNDAQLTTTDFDVFFTVKLS